MSAVESSDGERDPLPVTRKHEDLARLVSMQLVGGVILAASTAIIGLVMFLSQHGQEPPHFHIFRGEPHDLRSVAGIIAEACSGKPRGIMQLGLVFLVAVPVCRVALSMVGFAREKDWKFVLISAGVLCALLYSLMSVSK